MPGNTSVWVFPSENPDTHLDPEATLECTTCDEWSGFQDGCGAASAQRNRLGRAVRSSLLAHLQGALGRVSREDQGGEDIGRSATETREAECKSHRD
jgi:hypothetical protein